MKRTFVRFAALSAVSFALGAMPVAAQFVPGSFEAFEGYTLGDIQGQQGWSYLGNSYTAGAVTAAPAGTPAQLGTRSLLLSTRDDALDGVTTGVLSPAVGPYGIPGSKAGGVNGTGPTAIGNSYSGDFWFRTAADDAASSAITDGGFFFQANLASQLDRFGRVALFQRTGTTYNAITDSYKSYDTDQSDGDQSDVPDQTIATGLQFGQWYRLAATTTFAPVTQSGPIFTNHDVLQVEIFDAAGTSLGSVTDASSWMAAWVATPGGFNDANAGHYAVDRVNFLNRGQSTPDNAPSMYIDNVAVPEPSSVVLLGLGALAMAWRLRRRG
jgi:hypothetical protein